MANPTHLERIMHKRQEWNAWRKAYPRTMPDLEGAILTGQALDGLDLSFANLAGAYLERASLANARLVGANLRAAMANDATFIEADLRDINGFGAYFRKSNFQGALLRRANFSEAVLRGATLQEADLEYANFTGARMANVQMTNAILGNTTFARTDLSSVSGLQHCRHRSESSLDLRTLSSSGDLPLPFLRGVGLTDTAIDYLPSLANTPLDYYSVFISYATADEAFARQLHTDLQDHGVRCWFAPEQMRGGQRLHDQIDAGIKLHDKLLLVLSEQSMQSDWVALEVMRAREREKREGRQMLFPVRLVSVQALTSWQLFDADTVTDVAKEVRQYFIPDFSDWQNEGAYARGIKGLLKALKLVEHD